MKILVTGSTGFVGKNLIPYLTHNIEEPDFIPLSIRYRDSINDYASVYIHLAGKAHDTRNIADENEYKESNYLLTKDIFDAFLNDNISDCFIYMSSVKAIADNPGYRVVNEEYEGSIHSVYGKSKKLAEDYILSNIRADKRVYILRPCMIHGLGNKGNLNLLYKFVSKDIPWPLGVFENKRSFCSIDNLMFIIKELIERKDIPSGVYNVADDEALSTNVIISILAKSLNRKAKILKVSKGLIKLIAKLGDVLNLPLTTLRLQKLTESYVVSNQKIKIAIGKPLPVSARHGLLKTFNSFNKSAQ
jgi:nucleoside-diphosphate-sugar epimerase